MSKLPQAENLAAQRRVSKLPQAENLVAQEKKNWCAMSIVACTSKYMF